MPDTHSVAHAYISTSYNGDFSTFSSSESSIVPHMHTIVHVYLSTNCDGGSSICSSARGAALCLNRSALFMPTSAQIMVEKSQPVLLAVFSGRTGPGVCYRLWSEAAHAKLAEASPPEILSADLAPLALQLASWREDQPVRLISLLLFKMFPFSFSSL